MPRPQWTSQEIEIAVAQHFDYRANVIVPNVWWGWGLRHEADLIVLRPTGYCIEVEIKVSRSDIKADLRKRYSHSDCRIHQVFFAVPDTLEADALIPDDYGILKVTRHNEARPGRALRSSVLSVRQTRAARRNPAARLTTEKERQKLLELGVMRIWTLKQHLAKKVEKPPQAEGEDDDA